jgi:hypothetical protein
MSELAINTRYAGVWLVEHATLPNGEFAYTGTIAIEPRAAVFALEWDISAGRYVGLGLAHAAHLLVGCGELWEGLGVVFYAPHPSGVTVQWSTPELQGAVGGGAFTTPWHGTFEGQHQLTHTLPGAGAEQWTLTARKNDKIYELTWHGADRGERRGLGIETPGGLAAGWYPDLKQLAVLDYTADPGDPQRLYASWALGGYTGLGSETLVRQ